MVYIRLINKMHLYMNMSHFSLSRPFIFVEEFVEYFFQDVSFYYPYRIFEEEFRTRCNGFGRPQATNTQFRPEGRRHEVPPPKKKEKEKNNVLNVES